MNTFNHLLLGVVLLTVIGAVQNCTQNKQLSTSKLICYYSTVEDVNGCYCTHVILPANSDVKAVEKLKQNAKGLKVYVSVNEFNQGLIELLKTHKIDGLELDLKKLDTKNDITDFISTIKTKIGNNLDIVLSVPAKADSVAKYFDFKPLSKHVDLFVLQTAFLGASSNVTFHPSRLSGMWDVQNTDSVVDLVSGLGAPLSKLVISAPVQAFQFTLQNEEYTAPGSPALELQSITRNQLCKLMQGNRNWTLERDEDQAGPYIFNKNQWIAFEDSKSMDIKVKYSKIRGLAGVALKDLTQDGADCGSTILEETYNGLSRQARAPRGAVLHSLEREIVDGSTKLSDSVQLSPYKISRIIDTEGKIHVVRQDTRTEFQCSRQGYFVHPRSCNRFYRCVKFDQLSNDYNVFEFDCPAGLAFDERVEVCVWPGSLPHGTPCSGSSEIAPVPRGRFVCPSEPGYYADPENCRWFFACLDHGKSPLQAYEFRCPYGLVFDGERLVCEWPWLVPKCSNGLGVGLDSGYNSGVILGNYNGLGQLGSIKLGGLSGKIEKPIATVYSNVNGLNYKTSQALKNSGLLRVNNGAGYQGSINNANIYQGESGHDAQYGYTANSQGATGLNTANSGQVNLNAHGALSSQHFNQFQIDAEIAKHINIIGGGYSIVGTPSNVDIPTDENGIPLSRSPAIISVSNQVAAVPVPGSKSVSGFETVHGGVIANIPEYQYKIKSLEDAGLFANISSNFPNFVIATAANEATIRDQLSRGLKAALNPVSTDHPQVYISSTSKPITQDVYSSQSGAVINNYDVISGGHEYQKPSVVVQPQIVLSSTPSYKNNAAIISKFSIRKPTKTIVEDYTYQKPQVHSTYTYQSVAQNSAKTPTVHAYSYQPTGGSYQYVNVQNKQQEYLSNNGGYEYSKTYQYSTSRPETVTSNRVVTNYFNIGAQQENSEEDYSSTTKPANIDYSYHSTARPVEFQQAGVVVNNANSEQTQQAVGYTYSKPTVKFEETLVDYSIPKPALVTSYFNANSIKGEDVVEQNKGYAYSRPKFEEAVVVYSTPKPASYYNIGSTVEQQNIGYNYPKPEIKFEEVPVVSTPKSVQPAVVSSYYNLASTKADSHSVVGQENTGYAYLKPEVNFEKNPVVTSYYNTGSTKADSGNVVEHQNNGYASVTYSTPKSVQPASYYNIIGSTKVDSDTVVEQQNSGYASLSKANSNTVVEQQKTGYYYNRPEVKFEEVPVVYSTPKPVQPAIVTSNYNIGSNRVNSGTVVEQQNTGYVYPRPEIKLEEAPMVYTTSKPTQPAVVTSYYNTGFTKTDSDTVVYHQNAGYAYPRPEVKFAENPVAYPTPKPAQPAVVTSYFHIGSTKADSDIVAEQQNTRYNYPRPEVKFEEAPVIYSTPKPVTHYYNLPSSTPQPAAVTNYFNVGSTKVDSIAKQQNIGYSYSQPEIKFEEAPVDQYYHVPSSTPQPAVVNSYVNIVSSTPKPLTVNVQEVLVDSYYPQQQEIEINPRPSYIGSTTVEAPKPAVVSSYFNFESSKGYNYPKPTVKFEEERLPVQEVPFVKKTAYTTGQYQQENYNNGKVVVENYEFPQYEQVKQAVFGEKKQVVYQSTPKPTFASTIRTIAQKKLQPAVVTTYDSRLTQPVFKSTTVEPVQTYLPVTSTVKITSALPRGKVVEEYVAPEVTTLARDYLPTRKYLPAKITTEEPEITTLTREYLPVRTRLRIATTGSPSIKVTRPVTIIKQNDAHPLLSAKLGAQCTCVSNTLKLRKKQKIIIIEEDDNDDDDDGYIVDNNNAVDSSYESEKIVDITPKVYIRKQSRARQSISKISGENSTSVVDDKEIAKAVRTGLKLVKQAAKEGTQEALSKQFDRYGPGGLRGKSETLQGTIDCQRAGLFRHPTQCNKFYACRWDCTKNRFTLHIFNCPVHLTFDNSLGACNWPSQGPACVENTLITSD